MGKSGKAVICFSHGKESGPWGSKIVALAAVAKNQGFAVESIDYRGISDPDRRVGKLLAWQREIIEPVVLVGSSMGAYVAAVAAQEITVKGLFLLAPAISIPGFGQVQNPQIRAPEAVIIHGWEDEVIPAPLIIDYARRQNLALHLLPGSHRLMEVLPQVLDLFTVFLKNCRAELSV